MSITQRQMQRFMEVWVSSFEGRGVRFFSTGIVMLLSFRGLNMEGMSVWMVTSKRKSLWHLWWIGAQYPLGLSSVNFHDLQELESKTFILPRLSCS